MKWFYLVVAILGTLIPYAAFGPWLIEHGLDINAILVAISANGLSLFAWLDVVIAAVALIAFIVVDGDKNQVKHRYWALLATISVGVSSGLPLYLYLKERQVSETAESIG